MKKKVELPELFFDLVYVYAIGRAMRLLPEDFMVLSSVFLFLTYFLFLINIWVLQTVFINRFGRNSAKNQFFLYLDMMMLLLLSNTFDLKWSNHFASYSLVILGLTGSLFLQYLLEWKRSRSQAEKNLILSYLLILGGRFLLVGFSVFLPLALALISLILGLIMAIFLQIGFRRELEHIPVNFAHLLERFMLLTLITFGEMIMGGISHFFRLSSFSLATVALFGIVIMLFLFYYEEFSFAINENWLNSTGLKLIYLHYLIFLSLSFITKVLEDGFAHMDISTVSFLYLMLILYYFAILQHGSYNKCHYRFQKMFWLLIILVSLGFYIISLFFINNGLAVLLLTGLYTAVMMLMMKRLRQDAKKQVGTLVDNRY